MATEPLSPTGGAVPFGSEKPVGTVEELKGAGKDPRAYGTCSAPGTFNKGCPCYGQRTCPIRNWKGVNYQDQGPKEIAVVNILSEVDGGAAQGRRMPCFDWFYAGWHDRYRQAPETGEIIKIVGIEGEDVTYRERYTERLHKTRDEGMRVNCIACQQGTCYQRIEKVREVNMKDVHFPRPREVFTSSVIGKDFKSQMLADLDRRHEEDMLTRGEGPSAAERDNLNAKVGRAKA